MFRRVLSYLSDPLNAYAGLNIPKPYIHPLNVTADPDTYGSEGLFARNNCRANALLRLLLCARDNSDEWTSEFVLFELRDIKANGEIVLGWE
jgi:hypothetical protein